MAAITFDAPFSPSERPRDWSPASADFDPTTDVHEENTSDLAPATIDLDEPTLAEDEIADEVESEVAAFGDAPTHTEVRSPSVRSARAAPLTPGSVINDRYLIEALIGSGGVALVYRARDMHSSGGAAPNRQVALKTPRPETHDLERARARLAHEYQHTIALSHPNVVRALDFYADAQPCFMTTELITGKLLSTLVSEATHPFAPKRAFAILQGCARALAHGHGRNIVHGDFKPGNVFVTSANEVKIIDFGAAAAPFGSESRIAAGTPAYASPEVLSGATPEPRDDVFSLACVAYELFTGKHPFDRRSSIQARDEGCLPPRAWSLTASQWLTLLSALSWTREQRPADVEALVAALAPAPTPPMNTTPGGAPSAARRKMREELPPPQRSWGFFVFLTCALIVTYIASQRQGERSASNVDRPAAAPLTYASEQPLLGNDLMGAPVSSSSTAPHALHRRLHRWPHRRTSLLDPTRRETRLRRDASSRPKSAAAPTARCLSAPRSPRQRRSRKRLRNRRETRSHSTLARSSPARAPSQQCS